MCEQVNINVSETNETINIVSSEIQEVIDINVFETTEDVTLNITEQLIQVNINKVTAAEQIQSDWAQTDNEALDFIKNKPTIPTNTSDLTNDGEDGINPFITAADIPASLLVALPFTTDHLTATNNAYVIGDVVWYLGNVYRCIANNDSILPTATAYWTNLGAGNPLVEQPSDWNSTSGNNQILNKPTIPTGTVTSVGLTMPSAFSVANSPITSSGDISVTGAGVVSQYVRGDGSLANFPTSTGGGASLSFYLNGSVSQGTIGGVAFREMDRTPILGAGTDFTIAANGYIQSFITDANVPNLLEIPAGNWNFETYFSASSGGGSPSFYLELYKWNGTTLSLIASNSANPEGITNGTAIDLYVSALAVPQTTLLATDRLAIRIYVTHSGRTIKLHTENSHLCQVITTFSTGLTALNGLTTQVQSFATGTSGTDFGISSATSTHTFNLPTASAANRGALSSTDWSTFNGKFTLPALTSGSVLFSNGTTIAQDNAQLFWDDTNNRLGIGTATPTLPLDVNGQARIVGTLNLGTTGTVGSISLNRTTDGAAVGGIRADSAGTQIGGSGYSSNILLNNGTTGTSGILFTTGGERMRLFGATGNLAINTTTDAGFKLDVNGTARVSGNATFGTLGTGTGMFWDNTNNRLGIGTNAPSRTLELVSTSLSNLLIRNGSVNMITNEANGIGASDFRFRIWNNGNTNTLDLYGTGDYDHQSKHAFRIGGTERMRIAQTTGNVLINTTTDAGFKLDVNGTARVQGDIDARTGTTGFKFNQNAGSPQIEFWQAVARFTLTRTSNNGLDFSSTSGYCAHVSPSGTLIGGAARTDINASAQLDVISTTKGFLPPRMTTTQKNAIATPAAGLVVYDTTLGKLCVRGAAAWETITSI